MNFTNMNNPSATRHLPTREDERLPSNYMSLRERSPVRKPSPNRADETFASGKNNPSNAKSGGDRTATKFATVSPK